MAFESTRCLFELRRMVLCRIATIILVCYSLYAFAGVDIDRNIDINIPANTRLEDALIEWGLISGVTVMVDTTVVDGRLTKGVGGRLSARKALTLILMGSGLQYRQDGARIMVIPIGTMVHSGLSLESPATAAGASGSFNTRLQMSGTHSHPFQP